MIEVLTDRSEDTTAGLDPLLDRDQSPLGVGRPGPTMPDGEERGHRLRAATGCSLQQDWLRWVENALTRASPHR